MCPAATETSNASFNCSKEPTQTVSFPSSVRQRGNGIPQYRERLKFQSFSDSSQFPNRPVPVLAGFHWMVLFRACMRSLAAVARMNQLSSG